MAESSTTATSNSSAKPKRHGDAVRLNVWLSRALVERLRARPQSVASAVRAALRLYQVVHESAGGRLYVERRDGSGRTRLLF